MQNKRPFLPGILRAFDRRLLLNKPEIWSARTHLVLYYTLLTAIVLTAISFLIPDDPRQDSSSGAWAGLIIVLSLVGLVVWIIYLLRFNVFKRFGKTGAGSRLLTFLLYFISIGALGLLPFIQPRIESIRADMAYSTDEIVKDMNDMNIAIVQLEHHRLDHTWTTDTLQVISKQATGDDDLSTDMDMTAVAYTGKPGRTYLSREMLEKRIRTADSIRKLNDSVYLVVRPPEYEFVDTYLSSSAEKRKLTSFDIYHRVVKNYREPDGEALRETTARIIKKYRSYQLTIGTSLEDINSRVHSAYSTRMISESMGNIISRKERWDDRKQGALFRFWFYPSLVLALLVFTFRHSTARVFFLSLLSAILLLILTSVLNVFLRGGNYVWTWALIYFVLFAGISAFIFWRSSRSIVQGVALNLFIWLLPFIPFIVVVDYYNRRDYSAVNYDPDPTVYYAAEWMGPLILLLFLFTFIHQAYRKWFGAPESQ